MPWEPRSYTLLFKKTDQGEGTWEPERYNIEEPADARSAPVQLNQESANTKPKSNPVPSPPPQQTFQNPEKVQQLAINASYGMDLGRYSKNIVVNKKRDAHVPVENKHDNMWIPDYYDQPTQKVVFQSQQRSKLTFGRVDPKQVRALNPSVHQHSFVQTTAPSPWQASTINPLPWSGKPLPSRPCTMHLSMANDKACILCISNLESR